MKTTITIFVLLYHFCLFAQNLPTEVVLENGGKMLLNQVSENHLLEEPYNQWYSEGIKNYMPNTELVKKMQDKINDYHILAFFGSWCGDSKKGVPQFIKVLQDSKFPMDQLKLIALDGRKSNYKKSALGAEWGLNIKRVPTFILYKNGKEINRIVETPKVSWEADINTIMELKFYFQFQYSIKAW